MSRRKDGGSSKLGNMKLYKFLDGNKYVYTIAENILEAKKWIEANHNGAKFVTIEKCMS